LKKLCHEFSETINVNLSYGIRFYALSFNSITRTTVFQVSLVIVFEPNTGN